MFMVGTKFKPGKNELTKIEQMICGISATY